MKNQLRQHPVISIVIIIIYAIALWMAYSLFGLMGLGYVLVIPLPIIIFSTIVQRNKTTTNKTSQLTSIWSTPVPYLGIILLGSLIFYFASKFL